MRISDWSSDVCSSDLSFAQSLLQSRHGVLNLHKVPATHIGDFGIDYYCLADLVIYQCYAVEEPIDIAIRADRQKSKITTELKKLIAGASEVSKLQIGRAHVCTPVTNAHLVCRLLLDKTKHNN